MTSFRRLLCVLIALSAVLGSVAKADDGPWNGLGVGIFVRTHSFGNQLFPKGVIQSIRFVAEKTGKVRGVIPYLQIGPQPGYSRGDGGRVAIRLHEDDGNGQPGRIIGFGPIINRPVQTLHANSGVGGVYNTEFRLLNSRKPKITKGKVYHWVFTQLESGDRMISMGGVSDQSASPGKVGKVPVFGENMVHMRGHGLPLQVHPMKLPLFATVYTDGTHLGQLVHQGLRKDKKSVDGQNRIRLVMKPTTDRRIRHVYAAPWKERKQTSKNVKVEVKNQKGQVLARAILRASDIGYDRPPVGGTRDNSERAPWVKASLGKTLTLRGGQTYYVEFSAAPGADVWFTTMKEHFSLRGKDVRFNEIRGQYSTNDGRSWVNAPYRGKPNRDAMYSVLLHYN